MNLVNIQRQFRSAIFSLFVLVIGAAVADVKPPDNGGGSGKDVPPSAQPVKIKVVRGKATPIELRAITKTTREVTFLIRSNPTAGTIGDVERLPREGEYNRNQVIYLAPDGGTETSDSFQYAARLAGGAISAAATVEIEIENPKAVLKYRKGYGFGSVQIGASLLARIPIENVGTGPYRQVLEAAPPWEILLDEGILEIPEGQARELMVRYTPTEATDHRLELPLEGGEDGAMLIFTGEGAAPFIGSPTLLSLVYDSEQGDRRGKISLKNTLGHALTVSVVTTGNLKAESDRITLPALGKQDLLVTLAGKTAYQGDLKIRSFTGYEQRIAIEANTMPARVSILGNAATEGVRIERVLMGTKGQAKFGVQNVGGGEGTVILEATPPFIVEEEDRSFQILQGEERSVEVGIQSDVSGDFSGQLKLFCGDQVVSLLVLGSVVTTLEPEEMVDDPVNIANDQGGRGEAVGTETPRVSQKRLPADERLRLSSLLFHYGIGAQREFSQAVPQIESMQVTKRTKTGLEMEWADPAGGPYDYEIDIERLIRIPGYEGLMKFWIPFREAKLSRQGGKVVATLPNLKPGSNYRWRIATRSQDGEYSMPTEAVEVGTKFPARVPWKWILIGAGAVFAVGVWIQQRRAAFNDV